MTGNDKKSQLPTFEEKTKRDNIIQKKLNLKKPTKASRLWCERRLLRASSFETLRHLNWKRVELFLI